jgi:zinc transport system substrate-binding protein
MIVISGHSIGVRRLLASLAVVATLVAAGCSSTPNKANAGGRLGVVAAFYPLQFIAERIGGDRVAVTNLVNPGVEPHDIEPDSKQLALISEANLIVHLAGFQPAVDQAIESQAKDRAFDAARVEPLNEAAPGVEEQPVGGQQKPRANQGKDPHVWLDPVRLAAIGDKLADRFAQLDSAHADEFRARAKDLRANLTTLDQEYSSALRTCQRRDIVTSHAAFGYLAARYKLTQVPITGISPEEEPTPQRLAQVTALAKQKGVTTIYFETLVSPKIAETLAKEVGAKAEVLDPIEGLQPGAQRDYLSVMRDNLAKLRTGLGCT